MAVRNFKAKKVGKALVSQPLFIDFLVYALSPKKG